MHILRRHTGSNLKGCRPTKAKVLQNTWWPHNKDEVEQGMKTYWPIRHELAMIDVTAMKGKRIVIPFILQWANATVITPYGHEK